MNDNINLFLKSSIISCLIFDICHASQSDTVLQFEIQIIEFFVPYSLMLKAFGGYRKGEMAKNIFKIYSAGAVADFMFSPEHGNFASLLVELGIDWEFVEWLDSRPDEGFDIEEKMRSRGKQIIEGALLVAMFEFILSITSVHR